MSCHDPLHNQNQTKVAKLARKRCLELLSKKQFEPKWVSAVEGEVAKLEEDILTEGNNGKIPFNPFQIVMKRVLAVLLQFAFGQDLESKPGWLEEMSQVFSLVLFNNFKCDVKYYVKILPQDLM